MTDPTDWKPSEALLSAIEYWMANAWNISEAVKMLKAVRPLMRDGILAEEQAVWDAHAKLVADNVVKTLDEGRDYIEAAERERVLEEAAKVADADQVRECPYGTDKKGDPTWNHTEKDLCPVCHKNAEDSFRFCVATSKYRIANAIRALKDSKP